MIIAALGAGIFIQSKSAGPIDCCTYFILTAYAKITLLVTVGRRVRSKRFGSHIYLRLIHPLYKFQNCIKPSREM